MAARNTGVHSDDEFMEAWRASNGSPVRVSEYLKINIASVYARRRRMATKGLFLKSNPLSGAGPGTNGTSIGKTAGWRDGNNGYAFEARTNISLKNAILMVGSDNHYWPGEIPLAHKAFCILAKRLKPKAIIMNGDVFDGARISRHEPLGWQKLPTVIEELDTCKLRLAEIEKSSPKSLRYWTIGNHDSRYDRKLATEVSQMEEVPGMSIKDHFKNWDMSYSVMINEDSHPCIVKHAFRGGIHAVYNNTLHAGISIITGHLHAQLCRPFTDYRGTRYGVDAGCIANIDGGQFSYTLDGPVNWRSGFVVLSFDDHGRMLPPELCECQNYLDYRRAIFRGELIAEEKIERKRLGA